MGVTVLTDILLEVGWVGVTVLTDIFLEVGWVSATDRGKGSGRIITRP